MLIDINPAPCGAGKTHAIQHHAKSMAERGEHVLLAQPTKLLIRQTAGALRELGVGRVTAIFGGDAEPAEGGHERSVVARAVEHLRKPRDGGEVLLLTHSAHQRLPYVHRRHDWHLVYDEAPRAVWCHELNVPDAGAGRVGSVAPECREGCWARRGGPAPCIVSRRSYTSRILNHPTAPEPACSEDKTLRRAHQALASALNLFWADAKPARAAR